MSYNVEQHKGKHIYVYQVESYWDTDKQQSRQHRVYLGKKVSPESPLIPKRAPQFPLPRWSRDYGHLHLLTHIAHRLGLTEVLQQVFPNQADLLLQLAMYEVIEERPLYLFSAWAEDVVHPVRSLPNTPQLSTVLQDIGRAVQCRETFERLWIQRHAGEDAVFYDITSASSYSRFIDLCEWGYNREGETLPQINLGILCALPGQVPLAYRVYPGNLSDSNTLPNTISYLQSLGITRPLYIMDRGFWSQHNLNLLKDSGVRYFLPISLTSAQAMTLLTTARKTIRTPDNIFRLHKRLLYHTQMPLPGEAPPVTVHLYYDPVRKADEERSFYQRVLDLEDAATALPTPTRLSLQRLLETAADVRSCFTIKTVDGHNQLRRKPHTMHRRLKHMGYLLLATTEETTDPAAGLLWYHQRDAIEKIIDEMKHEMDGKRLRVHRKEAIEGRLFVLFLAMILRCAVEQACSDAQLFKKYSVAEIFAELKNIKQMELTNGKFLVSKITKKQQTLYEALGVALPLGT